MKQTLALALLLAPNALLPQLAKRKLDIYKERLEWGTYMGADWSRFKDTKKPGSRYETFLKAFEHFEKNNGKIVVELGTSHSFVHGGHPGCDKPDRKYWNPNDATDWDWGAGFFTRMVAEALDHLNPTIYSVDNNAEHLRRSKIMTDQFKTIQYIRNDSVRFLRTTPLAGKIDLLYLDTGYVWPVEPTAVLQLAEAKAIVEGNVMAPNGLVLIDDVQNQTPYQMGHKSKYGKADLSIPYLLQNGFEIISDEYQVILRKKK